MSGYDDAVTLRTVQQDMEVRQWKYFRDDISTLDDLDTKLNHWGGLGWELVTILHAIEPAEDNILASQVWMLIFKQPAH
jgi:hypothetical protein